MVSLFVYQQYCKTLAILSSVVLSWKLHETVISSIIDICISFLSQMVIDIKSIYLSGEYRKLIAYDVLSCINV